MPPRPGEALDSWFDALAHRMHVALSDLMTALGLPRRTFRRADKAFDVPADWTILLRPAEATAVSSATGVPADAIGAMTLIRYDQRAVVIDQAARRVNIRTMWGRGTGSRYCPDCLTDSGGRWQLRWRLNWTFACLTHRRLLADWCPQCGRAQRMRYAGQHEPPQPGRCAHPVDPIEHRPLRGRTGAHVRCHADLGQATTPRIPADHPALHAQHLLDELFESGTADFGVYEGNPQPAIAALADIRSVAGRAVSHTLRHDPAGVLPDDPVTGQLLTLARHEHQRTSARARKRPGTVAPNSAAGTAVGLIAAFAVLSRVDVHDAAEVLRPLITAPRGSRTIVTSPANVDDWGRTTSTILHAIQLAALGPRLRPTDQLRYRTASPTPQPTKIDTVVTARRVRGVPTLFWPAWTVQISPPKGAHIRILRPALSAALLLVGTRIDLADAADALGSVTSRHDISKIVQLLHASPSWPQIAAALDRLVEHLDHHPAPIDYQRRRHLDYRSLLPASEWRRVCDAAGARPGPPVRAHVARCVLFEQISGMPAHQAPFGAGADTATFRHKVHAFPTTLTPDLAENLQAAAIRLLARHSISTEPVSWQPPLQILHGLDLPGTDLDQLDPHRVHRLIRRDLAGIATAGRHVGVSSFAISALLLQHPAPRTADPPGGRSNTEILPPDLLARYHIDEHLSLVQIDRRAGLPHGTAARLARRYAIPVRGGIDPAERTHSSLPRNWIFDQHVNHGRSLADLAREKQLSKSTLNHWADIYQIPIQRRAIRMNIPAAAAAAPALLRPAITGPNAWRRLHRFADAVRFLTFQQAAIALGIHTSTLIDHINRLEREFDHPLLERDGRRRVMRPNAFGRSVAVAIRAADRRGS